MTLGEKIKKYRLLHNMTQKELGMKVGFSAVTADTRIRQYEKDTMAPKSDIRNKLVQALDVDQSALSDIDIRSVEDVVRVFFFIEEFLGFEIEKIDLENYQFFSKDKFYFQEIDLKTLNSYMYIWQQQKKNLLNTKTDNKEDSDKEYELWKSRFPRDIHNYWKSILNRIDTHYDPLVKSLYNTPKINNSDEFLTEIRMLIQAGFEFEAAQEFRLIEGGYLTLTFKTSDILSPKNKEIETLFAKFLYTLKTLEEYGMTIERNILTYFSGNIIVYHLRHSTFGDMHGLIRDMIKFEKEKNSMDEYSKELFETKLRRHFQFFYIDNLAKDIHSRYPSSSN